MKLEIFREKEKKKTGIIIGIVSIVLLLAVVFVYRTYSIYQEQQEFDVIKGSVPDQNYDIMFTFYLVDENGTKSVIQTVPEDKEYRVSVICNNEASGSWDYDSWGPVIANLNKTRTKCSITFSKIIRPLKEYGIMDTVVEERNGLYEVEHGDANITYTTDTTAINNLKMTEYRYAGSNPNNYVTFNGEEAGWRIIGLVNTPEGQRIKLIRDESIGNYSWDSSASTVNTGYGVNEWSQADLQVLLNSGAYYNRMFGTCYCGRSEAVTGCTFENTGLTLNAKTMIDTVTWNLGAWNASTASDYDLTSPNHIYNEERSTKSGKNCISGNYCNDSVTREISWKGQVGLIYPSDYGYATSGYANTDRDACLNAQMHSWNNNEISDCKSNNWIYDSSINQWMLTPYTYYKTPSEVIYISSDGKISDNGGYVNYAIKPSLYLKLNTRVIDGNGTKENPYVLNQS